MRVMPYFLVVYDQRAGEILELTEFAAEDRAMALEARYRREAAEASRPHVEVVLFGAESEKALRHTHARYFQSVDELLTGAGIAE